MSGDEIRTADENDDDGGVITSSRRRRVIDLRIVVAIIGAYSSWTLDLLLLLLDLLLELILRT